MAYSKTTFTGDGSNRNFTVGFPYLNKTHVEVRVADVLLTEGRDYTWLTSSTVRLEAAPAQGVTVEVKRNTPKDARAVEFQDSTLLTQEMLNTDANQLFFIQQEDLDKNSDLDSRKLNKHGDTMHGNLDMSGYRVTSLDDPIYDHDAVNRRTLWTKVGEIITGLQSGLGSYIQAGVGAIARSFQDKLRETVSVKDFGAVGDGIADDTAAIQRAFSSVTAGEIVFPQGTYRISASLDLRNRGGVAVRGLGLPTINQSTPNTPIFLMGGERLKLEGFVLKFASLPTSVQTDAVAIRAYNLYESIFDRLYIYQVNTGFDQYQGLVNGGQNAFFSNQISNIRIVNFSGWAIKLIPFSGGNSGSVWNNIYINNRTSSGPASASAPCLGGVWLQTAQNDVFNLLNIEWVRNTGPLLVLNQAGNATLNGLHIEGVYPVTNYNPLIDVPGGDNSCPTFNGLTVTGSDWGGAVGQALFRLDNQGTRVKVNGLLSTSNANLGGMNFLTNGGATCYGSYIEVDNACVDGSFASNPYSPKVSVGSVTPLVEYPVQRWNQHLVKHSVLLTDNAGGTLSGATMTGASTFDRMGLWNAGESRFEIKHPGIYRVFVTLPTSSNAIISVKKNYADHGFIGAGVGGNGDLTLYLNRGDTIQLYVASGNYTRTNAVFGLALVG